MIGGSHTRLTLGNRRGQDRAALWLLIGCAFVCCCLISLFTIRGFRVLQLRRDLQQALSAHDNAMDARSELERRLALQDDLEAIEDAARERLGWVLPGEERVIFVDRSEAASEENE